MIVTLANKAGVTFLVQKMKIMYRFYGKSGLFMTLMLGVLFLSSCAGKQDSGYVPTSGGASLYYEMKGAGPETLIFLHGHSLDTRMWDAQFDVFAKKYRCIRMDFRGYGRSSEQSEDFQFTHMDDVLTLMDSLRIEKAHVVGLSMGSFVAGDLLAIHPERLLSCVMASGGIHPSKGPSEPMTAEESAKREVEIAALKEKGVDQMKEEWLEMLVSGGGSRRESIREPLRAMIADWSAWQSLHKEVRLLMGRDAWKVFMDAARIQGVFYAEVRDRTLPLYDIDYLKADPSVKGEFCRLLLPALEGEDEEARSLATMALRYGLAAITGEDLTELADEEGTDAV